MAKKQAAQLQIEIHNNEEWEKLLEKEGLILVDVYSGWSGPCAAMSANLKKIKLEIGGDHFHLAQAKSDNITCLERFRNKSQPTWMFISNKKLVNLVFGANSPKLIQIIIDELEMDAKVREGTATRPFETEITDLTPEEQEIFDAENAIKEEAARIELEKKIQILHERRLAVANVVLNNVAPYGVIVVFPSAKAGVKAALADFWEPAGVAVNVIEKPIFTEAMVEEMLYFAETTFDEVDMKSLTSDQALVYLIKPTDQDNFSDDIDQIVLQIVYGESGCPPGSEGSPAQILKAHIPVPKEIKVDSAKQVEKTKASLAALELSTSKILSSTVVQSKGELRASTEIRWSKELRTSSEIGRSKAELEALRASAGEKDENEEAKEEEEEERGDAKETIDATGIWAPPNALTRATIIKMIFHKFYDPYAIPEPVSIPPHIAIAFDVFKRRDILKLMSEYPDDVMRYGFFTTDDPDTAQLLAKTVKKFDRLQIGGRTTGGRMVIQLSKKKSEAWCVFAQLNPTYMSHNTVHGEKECKLFFPEDYDKPEVVEVEEVSVKKRKGKKGRKPKAPSSQEAIETEKEPEEEVEDDAEEVEDDAEEVEDDVEEVEDDAEEHELEEPEDH